MIAAAYLLLSAGWLGLYAGFTDTDPREEVKAAFSGLHASRGSLSKVPLSPVAPVNSDARHAGNTLKQQMKSRGLAH